MLKSIGKVILTVLIAGIIVFFLYIATIVKVKNPSNKDIVVKIDDMTLMIKKGTEIKINLYPGKHTISNNDKSLDDFDKEYFDSGSFLNPTRTTYLTEYVAYYDVGTDADQNILPNNTVTINNKTYTGPYTVSNKVYMRNDLFKVSEESEGWDYDEHEQFPSTITTKENPIVTKIKQMLGFNYDIKRKISLIH